MNSRLTGATLALSLSLGLSQENYSTWYGYRTVTVNTTSTGANVSGSVADFPVLVRLTSAQADVFSLAAADGADVRFTDSAGTVRLKHQRERWDAAGQKAEFWVLVPSVAGNANTTIRMYWGKTGAADSSRGSGVFDTANGFVGVWHLGDAVGTTARPGAVAGSPAAQMRNFPANYSAPEGVIARCDTLRSENGAGGTDPEGDDYLDMGRGADYSPNNYSGFSSFTTGFSYSLWFYDAGPFPTERLLNMSDDSAGMGATTTSNRMVLMGDKNASTTAPNLSVRWGANGTGYTAYDATATYTLNAWHHVVMNKPAGTSAITLYLDGTVYATTSSTNYPNPAVVTRNYFWLGRSGAGDRFFKGKFDEPVLARASRSANWIKLSYETQKLGATSVILGPTQAPPVVVTHPQSQTATVGSTVLFTVTASGAPPLTYKWVKNLTDTVGTNSDTLRLTNVQTSDNGNVYRVVVQNAQGQAVSNLASLTLTSGPAITSHPRNQTVIAGASVKLGVVATGTAPLTYKWVKNDADTVGGLDSLTLNNVQLPDNGATYKCVVRNGEGQAVSASATLTVLAPPSIVQQPVDQNAIVGEAAKFGVRISGTPPFTYKWVRNNTDTVRNTAPCSSCNPASTTDSLSLTNVQFSDSGAYKCVVQNAHGQAISNVVRLMVSPVAVRPGVSRGGLLVARVSGNSIMFRFPEGLSRARISVADFQGRTVWERNVEAGTRELAWDGKSASGGGVTGIYWVRLTESGNRSRPLAETRIILTP